MSLDVHLYGKTQEFACVCACCHHEHKRYERAVFYSANITHNLGPMAAEAGIYKHIWRPEEIGITEAGQLVQPLTEALVLMYEDPPRFKKHNAKNGWGLYDNFVPWIEKYLAACKRYPEAKVEASR